MTPETFAIQLYKNFPAVTPDASRLLEGVRVESGNEILRCLERVQWQNLTLDKIEVVAGNFWQLSQVWMQYYLPAIMDLTTNITLDFDKFGELPENQAALMDVMFSYWCSIIYLQSDRFDITKNVFHGLTANQIDLLEQWIYAIDFETLEKTHRLPLDFDYSKEQLKSFIEKVKTLKA